jgi:hypothetical protein
MNKVITIDGYHFGILNGVIMVNKEEVPIEIFFKFVKFINENEKMLREYLEHYENNMRDTAL